MGRCGQEGRLTGRQVDSHMDRHGQAGEKTDTWTGR